MPAWIADIQGLVDVRSGDTTVDRRHILQVPEGQAEPSDDAVVLFPDAPVGVTGDATPATVAELQQSVDSIIRALAALGLVTDARS
jgi:hypothetical protein